MIQIPLPEALQFLPQLATMSKDIHEQFSGIYPTLSIVNLQHLLSCNADSLQDITINLPKSPSIHIFVHDKYNFEILI